MTPTELIAALERGETGPRIDCLIHAALHPDAAEKPIRPGGLTLAEAMEGYPQDVALFARFWEVQPLSTSLDACQSATPDGWWLVGLECPDRTWEAVLVHDDGRVVRGHAPTMAGAWAAAILRAKGGE